MRKTLLLSVPLFVLSVGYAGAAGINLGWEDCPEGATYALARTFACDTNAGANTLVGSFVAPAGIQRMSANEFIIDVQASDGTLPDWWGLRSGCRAGSLTSGFDFTAGPFSCYDYWQGAAFGAVQSDPPVGNRVRIKGLVAIPSTNPLIRSVAEGTHVYSFKAIIDNAKTAGSGSCGGCATKACIVLTSITLNQPPPLPMPVLTNPAASQHVTWQAGATVCDDLARVTPATQQTWGSIKALYR